MSFYRRPTRSGIVHAAASCRDCGWECESRNALALAAQHYDRYGHEITTEVCTAIVYGGAESKPKERSDDGSDS